MDSVGKKRARPDDMQDGGIPGKRGKFEAHENLTMKQAFHLLKHVKKVVGTTCG